jgi:transporter family-2 protein
MMSYLIPVVFVAGAATAIQVAMNSQLRIAFGDAITAALINFTIGMVSLLVLLLSRGGALPTPAMAATVPWWAWFSGMLGATFVAISALAARDLGVTLFFSLILAGQLIGSVLLDHFGVLGIPQAQITWGRVLGCVLLVIGVVMVKRG